MFASYQIECCANEGLAIAGGRKTCPEIYLGQLKRERGHMQDTARLVLPLSILTVLLGGAIAALILRLDRGSRSATVLFAFLFALLSFSSLLVRLRFGYGLEQLALIQRTLPLLVGRCFILGSQRL